MAITINGQSRRIALALSGGGFRAAAFHLGVMRKLQSLGLFSAVDLLSCVSGGSIAGAFVALNWGKPSVLDELENYLATRSIAVSSVIGGILDPFESPIGKLARTCDRDLSKGASLTALRGGPRRAAPRRYLNATNLSTGNMFFFVAGVNFSLAPTLAASWAFPSVFPPLRVESPEYTPTFQVDYVTLTDGRMLVAFITVFKARPSRTGAEHAIQSARGKDGRAPAAIRREAPRGPAIERPVACRQKKVSGFSCSLSGGALLRIQSGLT